MTRYDIVGGIGLLGCVLDADILAEDRDVVALLDGEVLDILTDCRNVGDRLIGGRQIELDIGRESVELVLVRAAVVGSDIVEVSKLES